MTRNVLADRPDIDPAQFGERAVGAMGRAFPAAPVDGQEHLIGDMDNHPKDRHVAAAGVHIGALALARRTMSVRKNRPPVSPAEVVAAIVRQQGFRALEDSLHVLVDRHRRDCDEDGLADHLWIQDVAYPEWVNSTESLVLALETCGNGDTRRNRQLAKYLAMPVEEDDATPGKIWKLSGRAISKPPDGRPFNTVRGRSLRSVLTSCHR